MKPVCSPSTSFEIQGSGNAVTATIAHRFNENRVVGVTRFVWKPPIDLTRGTTGCHYANGHTFQVKLICMRHESPLDFWLVWLWSVDNKNKMKKRCDRFCCYSPSAPPTEGPTDRQLASFQSHTDWQITNQKKILNWRVTMSAHLQALQGEVPEASAPVSFFFLLFSSPPTKKKEEKSERLAIKS